MSKLTTFILVIIAVFISDIVFRFFIEHYFRGKEFMTILRSYNIFLILGTLTYSIVIAYIVFLIFGKYEKWQK